MGAHQTLGKKMNTTKRQIRVGIAATIILAFLGSWFGVAQLAPPSFPRVEAYSHEPIEVRKYNTPVLPRDGKDFSARLDQFTWRVTRSGQSRLIVSARLSGAYDLKSAFESVGYQFPSGTSITDRTSPGWTIRHHPSVLDHIERYLKIERIP